MIAAINGRDIMATAPTARLAFFKLNVEDMAPALAFWEQAFGFAVTGHYDTPAFNENILALPGQAESGPSLMLVEPKPRAPQLVGQGYGPVGLMCVDINASFAHAVAAGATPLMAPEDVGGVFVAMLASPQGHEIELVMPVGQ